MVESKHSHVALVLRGYLIPTKTKALPVDGYLGHLKLFTRSDTGAWREAHEIRCKRNQPHFHKYQFIINDINGEKADQALSIMEIKSQRNQETQTGAE